MKIKKLLVLVSMLAVMFSLSGCDEKYDKPFAYDETEIAVHAMTSFMSYETISDEYIDYYINSGNAYEQSAVKGIVQARETDKIGEYEDYSATAASLSDGIISLKDAGVEIENNKDYVNVILTNNATNREVEITIKYVENADYYILYNQYIMEQGLDSFETFSTGMQYAAAMNGLTMEEIYARNGVTNMEDLYQVGLNSIKAQLNAQGLYPYLEEEMVVSAVYSKKELVGQAGMNTLIGMGTVFIVLIFISFIISLFKYLPALFAKKPKVEPEKKAEATKTTTIAPVASNENLANDSQLVAVITAAIYAYEAQSGNGAVSKDKLVVRSIKRVRK